MIDALNFKLGEIAARNVHAVLQQNMLADGLELVLDMEKSYGTKLVDKITGDKYFDFFSFFASSPLGLNHPKLHNPEFIEKIGKIAAFNKPSNSDLYTVEMAQFVETFRKIAAPDYFKYFFFIDGGALAVENGLKTAFDWKVKKNFKKGYKEEKGLQVIHFKEAFHGRSGYTMSLTNTDINKVQYYPKFNWPRITNPKIKFPLEKNLKEVMALEAQAIDEIYAAIRANKDDIALIILEPIQGEGGDNQFRKEFFVKLREIADENDILLMLDEVQTGIGLTGKMWAHEHFVKPDIVSFGKKMQVCGIMASDRIDDVEDNVFHKSSRINSTWGGNLTDMVRSTRNLEIIAEEHLVENAKETGAYMLNYLKEIEHEFSTLIFNARGLGLMCAFDFADHEKRNEFLKLAYKNKLLILGCGGVSVRFRPALTITKADVDEGLKIIRNVLFLMRQSQN